MENYLISIIVPVYNVESYLRKCVDSIINQTYKNLEIILIDDGSPDNCGKICDKYAQQDSRVKVIHKKNGGVSDARNAGIEHSKGQYIAFVDPDDTIHPEMYKTLLNESVKQDADIVQCNFCYVFEDGHIQKIERKITQNILQYEQCVFSFFNGEVSPVVVAKLFKSSLLKNIRFNTNLKMSEDRLFVYECCCKAVKVKLLENIYYYYFQREDSAIHSFDIKQFDDDIYVTQLFLNERGNYKGIRKRLEVMIVNRCVTTICGILREKKYYQRLPDIREKLMMYKKRALLSGKTLLKIKIYVLLLWLFPDVFYKIYPMLKQ